jgi:hypothetical protein
VTPILWAQEVESLRQRAVEVLAALKDIRSRRRGTNPLSPTQSAQLLDHENAVAKSVAILGAVQDSFGPLGLPAPGLFIDLARLTAQVKTTVTSAESYGWSVDVGVMQQHLDPPSTSFLSELKSVVIVVAVLGITFLLVWRLV